MDAEVIWQIITVVFIPIVVGGFLMLKSDIKGVKTEVTKQVDGIKAEFDMALQHAKNNASQNLNSATQRLDKDGTEQWAHINAIAKALADFKLHAEERYAKDSDVKILIAEVKRQLEKIDDKLDHLAGIRSKQAI